MLKCSIILLPVLALIFSSSILYADVDYTKDPKPRMYMAEPLEAKEEEKGECGGECGGKHTAAKKVYGGKCPDPCDKKILDELEKEAKKAARRDAIKNCQEAADDPNCLCAGGVYNVRRRRCRTLPDDRPGHDPDKEFMCLYDVKVRYQNGTCKNIP
ncbi:MAG: hypothetical protein ACYSTI_13900 [Planctomycetota bacterium]|jgi:hypothetical protein